MHKSLISMHINNGPPLKLKLCTCNYCVHNVNSIIWKCTFRVRGESVSVTLLVTSLMKTPAGKIVHF